MSRFPIERSSDRVAEATAELARGAELYAGMRRVDAVAYAQERVRNLLQQIYNSAHFGERVSLVEAHDTLTRRLVGGYHMRIALPRDVTVKVLDRLERREAVAS